jgi:hypothetical protein
MFRAPLFEGRAMRTPNTSLIALGLLLLVAASAAADTVRMKDGSSYDGKILSEDDKQVVIETADLGALPLGKDKIQSIEREADKPAGDDGKPAGDGTGENGGDGTAEADGEQASGDDAAKEPTTASGRLNQRMSARIVRTTRARKPAAGAPEAGENETPKAAEDSLEATIGGQALAELEPGADVIVFQPPAQFAPAPEVILIGKRTIATLEMAGTAAAYLKVNGPDGPQRIPMLLADVKRHVEIKTPSARARVIEGVSAGDWLRVHLIDGSVVQGRLKGYARGGLELFDPDTAAKAPTSVKAPDEQPKDGEQPQEAPANAPVVKAAAGRTVVAIHDIVTLDGFFNNKRVATALAQLKEGEPIGVVRFPDGVETLGRFVALEKGRILLDRTGDGAPDTEVWQDGPIAQIRRVPARVRREITQFRTEEWVRIQTNEYFEDARIDRTYRGKILGLTVDAICLEAEGGAIVVPLGRAHESKRLPAEERSVLKKRGREVAASKVTSDVTIVPGSPVAAAAELDEASGVSVITNGREVSHVFVSAPYTGSVFGVRLGETAVDEAKASELDFDIAVITKAGGIARASEMVSDTLEGLRVTMLLDSRGSISAIEISRRD